MERALAHRLFPSKVSWAASLWKGLRLWSWCQHKSCIPRRFGSHHSPLNPVPCKDNFWVSFSHPLPLHHYLLLDHGASLNPSLSHRNHWTKVRSVVTQCLKKEHIPEWCSIWSWGNSRAFRVWPRLSRRSSNLGATMLRSRWSLNNWPFMNNLLTYFKFN